MLAPILGPTIGGLILDNASWRWIFYVNLQWADRGDRRSAHPARWRPGRPTASTSAACS